MMRHLANPDETHDDCQGVCIPKWAFKVGMGFLYVTALCFVMTIALVVGMMFMISGTAFHIRQTQVRNAKRFDKVVEEVTRDGDVRSLPKPPPE